MAPESPIEVTVPSEPVVEAPAAPEVVAPSPPPQGVILPEALAGQSGAVEPAEFEPSAEAETIEVEPLEGEVPRAPASSRRPVAPGPDEPIADIAFGTDELQPPRHTPPPESGRLPASPVEEFDSDVTGVRAAPQSDGASRKAALESPSAALLPEVTRAVLPSSADVTDVVGEAQAFAPSTFAAWLDATLSL
jgi:ribonuclease E